MLQYLKDWYTRKFSDPDAVTLFLLLVTSFAVIILFGDILAPIIVALVLAYFAWMAGAAATTNRITG